MKKWSAYLVLGLVAFIACKEERVLPDQNAEADFEYIEVETPAGFPAIDYPMENRPTAERIELGRLLFHDARLSRDNTVSCASCHLASHSFADNEAQSVGVDGLRGDRNAPSLANVAYHPYFFMDGGVQTLERQVIAPLDNVLEMDHDIVEVSDELSQDEFLNSLAKAAYGRNLDPFVLTRSIAAYERTLLSGDSPYDCYLQGDQFALTAEEKAGMELFFSERTQCGSCHSGFLLTDFSFNNIGLGEEYLDKGRRRVSGDESDNGKFKTPSLRNVALTAPYMHDGSLRTLEEVIDHFNSGGVDHDLKDDRIQQLNLTEEEQSQLKAFLLALTDKSFVTQDLPQQN
ncbi:MAG: cytochrome-c peroxidase [Flavobacteriales bacterium]|nr:cytochrome-c peroxidase [Flavobacteriales bacterium]